RDHVRLRSERRYEQADAARGRRAGDLRHLSKGRTYLGEPRRDATRQCRSRWRLQQLERTVVGSVAGGARPSRQSTSPDAVRPPARAGTIARTRPRSRLTERPQPRADLAATPPRRTPSAPAGPAPPPGPIGGAPSARPSRAR